MNWPPCWRANARLNSDMYAVPTWGSPVGDGATRTLTGRGCCCASATGHHPVGEGADLLDGHADLVADRERSDPGGRAGEDDVARQQRHGHADVRDELVDAAHHLRGPAGLLELAVDGGGDRQVGGVNVGGHPRADRAERVEALGPPPLRLTALDVTGGHV